MDEPFTALDELTREDLTGEVLRLWQRFRPTVLWVTHSISEAVRMADRVLIMSPRPGRIHTRQTISLSRPRDDTSGEFQDLVRSIRADLAARK
jgi:NitT/TauT family transport system ATP-binding protein